MLWRGVDVAGDRRGQRRRANPRSWVPALLEAIAGSLDIVSGMHVRLTEPPALAEAADRYHRRLIDVRTPPRDIPIARGRKRSGKRLLTSERTAPSARNTPLSRSRAGSCIVASL